MKSKLFLVVVLAGVLMVACGGLESKISDPLDGSSWDLVFYRKSTVVEGTTTTASFENGQISGSAGCNSYFGAYQIDGTKISFDAVGSTEMYCMDPEGLMEQETMFLEWLLDGQSYKLSDDQLMIFRSDGEALTFVPKSK